MNGKAQPVVLTIAGFDPSGGAGIIADIKAIHALGCSPVAAITSLTLQNSKAFAGAMHQTADMVRSQVQAIMAEHEIAAIKIGMLPTPELVREVTGLLRDTNLPAPVVDPVLQTTSGYRLIDEDAIRELVNELLPVARVITPNIPEAEKLSGQEITSETEMRVAAARIREVGARAVLIKGGHRVSAAISWSGHRVDPEAIDLLDDNGEVTVFRGAWIVGPNVRGTGCMLSSAIAACLAKKMNLTESVRTAKAFVADKIRQAQI